LHSVLLCGVQDGWQAAVLHNHLKSSIINNFIFGTLDGKINAKLCLFLIIQQAMK
jgi:hypothetical protein